MTKSDKAIVVEVEARTETGKNANRRLRATNRIPCNVYGLRADPFSASVAPKRIEELLREAGRNAMVTLALPGAKDTRAVMIRELQRDPVSERLLHVDFVRLDLSKPVRLDVPVHVQGTATGVKNEGGILDFVQRTISVSCLPADIPEGFDIDVSELHVGQHLSVSDIEFSDKFEVHDLPDTILVTVAAPKAEEEPEPTEEELAAAEGEEGAVPAEGEAAEESGAAPADQTDKES